MIRIAGARTLGAYNVELTLSDCQVIRRDLESLLKGPVFAQIRGDEKRFRELRVEGGSLVWPEGADLCSDVVIWGGLPPGDATSNAPERASPTFCRMPRDY